MSSFVVICGGIVLGAIVAVVWTILARWFSDTFFWRSIGEVTTKLVAASPPQDFFRQYGLLVRNLGVYLLKTFCRVTISILPVITALWLFWPMIAERQLNLATHLVVYSPQDLVVQVNGETVATKLDGSCDIPVWALGQPGEISASDWALAVSSLSYPVAISNSPVTRMALLLCGFKVYGGESLPPLLILRPSTGDANPLWPYLSDLEFSFWLAMFGASLGVGVLMKWAPLRWPRARRRHTVVEQKPTTIGAPQPSTDDLIR